MTVAVLGSGAFGTALAITLGQKAPTLLWSRDPHQAAEMQKAGENARRLPGRPLPGAVTVTADMALASSADVLLLTVPMQQLRQFLKEHRAAFKNKVLVACCKGMELETGLGPIDIMVQVSPETSHALLTGPSFASDIAAGLPTGLTLACADDALGRRLQALLSTPALRLYRSQDVIGASLGGALKNVIAIACGTVMGAGLGESARAALLTRGFAEMQRLALHRGALPDTLAGLSGFGDLVLTCTSAQSRNYRLGLSIGRGEGFDASVTVEGAATAQAANALAQELALDLPITSAVAGLLEKRLDVTEAMTSLLSRALKEE
ncbi:NAD(P)-dependent glycerol-3-phosphate dehydrogenase [Roseobacter sp. YSTF-M11]|uniref:Glycerol-3-phosphate dehydrogenase [NAD(P)+] n=1 Tax=Roseobacter insulae TaxID=2859783 RepID=A0A9X1FSI1_9RHOB|nr:NAD(P)H-dependent glycerol-3-phosphate dehydrogenase [Roseobacter insulae]MBW4706682.1 NAD(P)-dependent glycerol-3-phosphate dehydrogenase [Roseobacter insulae]